MATAPDVRGRALSHRSMVRRAEAARREGDRGGARTAGRASCRRTGRRPFSNGCENIEPWCVSRQLWWGHRIPAWYGAGRTVFVERDRKARGAQAVVKRARVTRRYGLDRSAACTSADEDVLDTWFSSALWPFSTLGWPERRRNSPATIPPSPGHRLRHHLLLGRPDDDDGPQFHGRGALPQRLHPRAACATRRAPRCRSPRATSSIRSSSSTNTAPMRCASPSPPWRRKGAT